MDQNLGKLLNHHRRFGIGCDMAFRLQEDLFPAHKAVLIARMGFFRSLFSPNQDAKSLVTLDSDLMNGVVLEQILQYIYTWEIEFTIRNVDMICIFARCFRFEELLNKGLDFLRLLIDNKNAIMYLDVSVNMDFKLIEKRCFNHIMSNIIPKESLREMIADKSLERMKNLMNYIHKLSKHEEMYLFTIEWIRENLGEKGVLPELLASIPLYALPYRFLEGIVQHEKLIKECDKCMKLYNEAISKGSIKETLYALGGTDCIKLSSVSKLESLGGKWIKSTPLPYAESHFGCTVYRQKIFIIGGFNERDMREMDVLELKTQTWKNLSSMLHGRQCFGVAELNGFIYVAGGLDFDGELSAVERYCIRTNCWSIVPAMHKKRFGLELVKLDGYLYAIGGNNKKECVSNTAERFDPVTGKWTLISNMNASYFWFGAAVYNHKIYIVKDKNAEVYDPVTGTWQALPSCPANGECGMRLAVFRGKLLAIGGRTGESAEKWTALSTVHSFDENSEQWTREQDMDAARWYHGVVAVPEEVN